MIEAVVVSYYPDATFVENIRCTLAQVGWVTIVDNGTTGPAREYVAEASRLSDQIEIVELGKNEGIASALNVAADRALGRGSKWLLELDQDSTVTPGMVRTMLDAYEAYPERDKVAVLCPVAKDMATGHVMERSHRGRADMDSRWREVLWEITSGSLTKVAMFERVGFYDGGLFIDCVDVDFCLKCARKGYRTLQVSGAVLKHRLGERTRHRLLWRYVYASNHSATRRYYIARNRVVMLRRYLSAYPVAMLRMMIGAFYHHLLKAILYEDAKAPKVRCFVRGLWHGFRGKSGPLR